MPKYHRGEHYVFAGGKESLAARAPLRWPAQPAAPAVAISDGATIPISNGRFSDHFTDGNAIVYRIDNQ